MRTVTESLIDWQPFTYESPYKDRIEAIGFTFRSVVFASTFYKYFGDYVSPVQIKGFVDCLCGKTESFNIVWHEDSDIDPYKSMFENNFNPQHLLEDGFPDPIVNKARIIHALPFQHEIDALKAELAFYKKLSGMES